MTTEELQKKLDEAGDALRVAHHELTTLHGLHAIDTFDSYGDALKSGCDNYGAWKIFIDEMWQVDVTKTLKAIDDALGQERK